MFAGWSLDISELFQLLLLTPLVLLIPKALSFFPMDLDDPLILIFAKVFEVVHLMQYLSVANLATIRSSVWKFQQ